MSRSPKLTLRVVRARQADRHREIVARIAASLPRRPVVLRDVADS